MLHPILGKFTQVQFAILFKTSTSLFRKFPLVGLVLSVFCQVGGDACRSIRECTSNPQTRWLAQRERGVGGGGRNGGRERDTASERDRQTNRQTDRQTDRQTERDKETETDIRRQTETDRERETGTGGNENKTRGGENLLIAVFSDCPSA